ncbi:MAG TPA: glycosyltransferase family 4 protein [Candidatus Dormibacteraeota bacterium]|nr:glycosyltransferase family 4 protein [Candidatus Dormibacteraeota bacterium]
MSERRYRVLAVAAHPVQYMAHIFRRMANHPAFDLHVAYCTLRGAEPARDPEFDTNIKWDVPLLDGYFWSAVPKCGSGPESLFGLCNPGLWKLIRAGNFDAVLCFTGYQCVSFWIALLAAKSSKTAFVFGTDATTLVPRDGRTWKILPKKIFWRRLFRLADQVIVPSSGSLELMLSLGLPFERVTLTPYSVDNDWWIRQHSQVDRAGARAMWGASQKDAVVLFCAKFQPWKRPIDLLRAFAKANIQNALLIFAGEGPLRPRLESEAAVLGIASQVRFPGFVNQSQLPAVYASADLMVLPSEYEPFAVVVNEAMCCGCPVVVSDRVGAARDLVVPVAPQFVFPYGDVDALAHILKDALTDRTRLQAIAEAARTHIQTWSPRRNIAATLDAIRIGVTRARGSTDKGKAPSHAISKESAVHGNDGVNGLL